MVVVHLADGITKSFEAAGRISTDEHNNLEIWGGAEGESLIYVAAQDRWIDVSIEVGDG